MLEFGVEVSTGELVVLERALRDLDTADAWSALSKGHRAGVVLTLKEREAVLEALSVVMSQTENLPGLAQLSSKLEQEQAAGIEPESPPPARRTTRK
jgi:hypothetical protein